MISLSTGVICFGAGGMKAMSKKNCLFSTYTGAWSLAEGAGAFMKMRSMEERAVFEFTCSPLAFVAP